jgi:hypothetical protein
MRGTETLLEALVNGLASIRPGLALVRLVNVAVDVEGVVVKVAPDALEVVVVKVARDALEVNEGKAPSDEGRFEELVEMSVTVGTIDDKIESSSDVMGEIANGKTVPM